MTGQEADDSADSAELVNAELAARLTRQDQSLSRIETKATVVVGFAATAAQFLATRYPTQCVLASILAGVALVGYTLAFALGVWAIRVTKYKELDANTLRDYVERPKSEVLRRLASARRDHFNTNASIIQRKARWWWASVLILAASLTLSAVAFVQTG